MLVLSTYYGANMDKIVHAKTCNNCGAKFDVTERDHAFYLRVNVPEPIDCPVCRENRRLTFRNEKKLYLRRCDLCDKQIVSIYSEEKPYHVYCPNCWWSDKWDPLETGRDYDFNRPFFEQYDELIHDSKLLSLFSKNSQNSDYINQETDDKNCYMNAGGHFNEDCYYNTYSIWGKNNVDNYWVIKSELLYECIRCENCFRSTYIHECENCSDCHYCRDMKGCANCFGCFGLRHKEYCFFNKQLEKEDYETKIREHLNTLEGRKRAYTESRKHFLKYPHKAVEIINCENSTGDDLLDCKNMTEGYLSEKMHDCKYAYIAIDVKDSMDLTSFGWGEMNYNVASSGDDKNDIAVTSTWDLYFSYYCFVCLNSYNLFGCCGINRRQYCILNKQYSKEEYEVLLPRIINHMKKTGEWGQFFPSSISPFGYNETVAQEYYPLTKEQAIAKGYKWKDEDIKEYKPQTYEGPYDITKVQEDIIKEILTCKTHLSDGQACGKNYKIIKEEFTFYKKMNLPIPENCMDCRHKRRLSLRNSRRLLDRQCQKCQSPVKTTYSVGSPEIVYCESCYLETLK